MTSFVKKHKLLDKCSMADCGKSAVGKYFTTEDDTQDDYPFVVSLCERCRDSIGRCEHEILGTECPDCYEKECAWCDNPFTEMDNGVGFVEDPCHTGPTAGKEPYCYQCYDARRREKGLDKEESDEEDEKEAWDCDLCGCFISDDRWGHNPAPLPGKKCCQNCNFTKVLPARMAEIQKLAFSPEITFLYPDSA
jgi:hypothetical protein